MNRKIIFPLIGLVSATAISATLLAAAPKTREFSVLADDVPSFEITGEMLRNTALEDFEMQDNRGDTPIAKTDKKFKIDIGNDKYILGALIFGDCDHQFTGNTLGDDFGLDNLEINKGNAVNFNLVLSFQNVVKVTTNFHINSMQKDGVSNDAKDKMQYAVKTKTLDPRPTTEEEFYARLYSDGYKGIVDGRGGVYYNYYVKSGSGTKLIGPGETLEPSFTNTFASANLLVIQFTQEDGNLISANRKITFSLKTIFVNYSCN